MCICINNNVYEEFKSALKKDLTAIVTHYIYLCIKQLDIFMMYDESLDMRSRKPEFFFLLLQLTTERYHCLHFYKSSSF